MLLNFGAKNFYCFKDGIEVSLELGANCPKEISKGKQISNILCIKGANGSGKTNLIKILAFLKDFCCNSWNRKPEETIPIKGFFESKEPIEIYCEFLVNDNSYLYESIVEKDKVISEKLSRKKDRYKLLFHRHEDNITSCIKEFEELKQIKFRSNASIISTSNQYQVEKIKPIYKFFDDIRTNVIQYGRVDSAPTTDFVAKYYNDNPDIFNAAIDILKAADLGISDIKIYKYKNEAEEELYYPMFFHDANVKENFLTIHSESSGTQAIFRNFPFYYLALTYGGILALDEFDKDLHPHILPRILEAFDNEEYNPRNAQLIITAHNTEIIDHLGKYRTFLVNKEKSESYGYRLDEIGGELLRNDRTISGIYNKGKIGGVPSL